MNYKHFYTASNFSSEVIRQIYIILNVRILRLSDCLKCSGEPLLRTPWVAACLITEKLCLWAEVRWLTQLLKNIIVPDPTLRNSWVALTVYFGSLSICTVKNCPMIILAAIRTHTFTLPPPCLTLWAVSLILYIFSSMFMLVSSIHGYFYTV